MRTLIFILATVLSLTANSQTVFKVSEVDSFKWGETLSITVDDKSFKSFTTIYSEMQTLFNYNNVDVDAPLINESEGSYDLNNISSLFSSVSDGTSVELVYSLIDTDKHYVVAYVFFDEEGYGITIWAGTNPHYDPRRIK